MLNKRENLLACLKRENFEFQPYDFWLCPSLEETYKRETKSQLPYQDYFEFPWRMIKDVKLRTADKKIFENYFDPPLKEHSVIDDYGVGHEPGSEAAKHMTYMRNPMKNFDSIEQFQAFPYPEFHEEDNHHVVEIIKKLKQKNIASVGDMQMTIWEQSWYMRGMMELMMDMMSESEFAEYHFDRVLDISLKKAEFFVKNGVDILFIGDDIGMQSSIMMSLDLYRTWIKPRLKKLISKVKSINPELLVMYHSCGYVEPFIGDLIDAGVDILNPVQPECMSFEKLYKEFGSKISFCGTIGTQTVMPFGTPNEIKAEVKKNLDITQGKGGLVCCPTHMLEPEVPWENLMAYLAAVKEY